MKRVIILTCSMLVCLCTMAQRTPLAKYDVIPQNFQQVYYDLVKSNVVRNLPSNLGNYFGQISDDGQLTGFGVYEGLDGGTLIGQYFKGTLIFGITMNREFSNVGTRDTYACYSSTNGQLLGIMQDGELRRATDEEARTYMYAQFTYDNGDRYVGEIYNGKRHGYGVYYFKNGGFWYGLFIDNKRSGYGAHFTSDSKMKVGLWNE